MTGNVIVTTKSSRGYAPNGVDYPGVGHGKRGLDGPDAAPRAQRYMTVAEKVTAGKAGHEQRTRTC